MEERLALSNPQCVAGSTMMEQVRMQFRVIAGATRLYCKQSIATKSSPLWRWFGPRFCY